MLDIHSVVCYYVIMDEISSKEIARLFKGYGINQQTYYYTPYVRCAVCKLLVSCWVSSGSPFWWNVIHIHKKETYGISTVICTKKCLYAYIRLHAGELLFKLL